MDEELRGEFAVIRTRLDALDKVVMDFRVEVRGRLDAIERRLDGQESRLHDKASNIVVSLWGATLAILIGTAVAMVKWV
jgi:tetrahydromethanopterin S-methyltransferase subunit G